MKKKIIALLIGATMVCSITACGNKEAAKATTGAAGKVVAEEVKEAVEEAAEEAAEIVEEPDPEEMEATEDAIQEAVEEELGSINVDITPELIEEMLEKDPYGFVDENAFPKVTWVAKSLDKSSDYGVWSLSCYDLDQFLDADGHAEWADDYSAKEYSEYSGRFCYPAITKCDLLENLVINEVTDGSMWMVCDNGDSYCTITINTGTQTYDYYYDSVGYGSDTNSSEILKVVHTNAGDSEVIKQVMIYSIGIGADEDNMETEDRVSTAYTWKLGNFSVTVDSGETELTDEQIDTLAASFNYVGAPSTESEFDDSVEVPEDEAAVETEDTME